MPSQDLKLSSASALRNREPIFELLRTVLPQRGTVLEIASGSGEHVIHFAALLPELVWQPSDPSPEARASILEWSKVERLANIRPPLDVDASSAIWPIERADAIIAINMVHISPWAATEGLLKGASRLLPADGTLILYGPYRQTDKPFAQSNVNFDASLRARNPEWGIRLLDDVVSAAALQGLASTEVVEMPANNLSVVFKRQ